MNINQIQYFLEIARCGSFLEASKRLHMTQPTLGRQITTMEEELNVQLFQRGRHGVVLTPPGEVLYSEWDKLLAMYNNSVMNAQIALKGIKYTLSIGILDDLRVDGYLPDFLKYLESRHPNIHIYMRRLSFGEINRQLTHDELDMAFSIDMNFANQPELKIINVKTYKPMLLMPADHPLAGGNSVKIADLKDEEFAIVNRDESEFGVNFLIDYFKNFGNFMPKLYFVTSMANVLLWVESGIKCAILGSEFKIIDNPNIKCFDIPRKEGEISFLQAAVSKKNKNPAVALALSYFENKANMP